MRNLFILIFFLPLITWAQSSLPPCPETGRKHNCWGEFTGLGWKYVGEFMNGTADGEGIRYRTNGDVAESGRWKSDSLVSSYTVDTTRFPFNAPSRVAVASPSQQSQFQSSLPPCPDKGMKHNCTGSDTFAGGARYVGEYRNGRRFGDGILYNAEGGVISSGRWQDFALLSSYPIDASLFPFDPYTEIRKRQYVSKVTII